MRSLVLALALALPLHAQDTTHHWGKFAAGFATSVAAHEASHIAVSLALGKRPTFGLDKGRPTIFSGIDVRLEPHKQFLFSSAGLTTQSLLDEIILDVPHARAGAFQRGILAGGLGTTLFYLTIGRNGSVSDVSYMARTRALTKTQVTWIYGGVALAHSLRIANSPGLGSLFMRARSEGGFNIGFER